MKQLCIYPHDIAQILGKSISHARSLVRLIKSVHDKNNHQPVTIREFSEFMDIPYEDVFNMINKINTDKDDRQSA